MKEIEKWKKLMLEKKLETLTLLETFPLRVGEHFNLLHKLENSGEPLVIIDGSFSTPEEEAKLSVLDYNVRLTQCKKKDEEGEK